MASAPADSRAFYQLFADLASGTLEHVTDPVRCAEYVASQVRELLGVKAVAVFACQEVIPRTDSWPCAPCGRRIWYGRRRSTSLFMQVTPRTWP